jgi:hypothetical protein
MICITSGGDSYNTLIRFENRRGPKRKRKRVLEVGKFYKWLRIEHGYHITCIV